MWGYAWCCSRLPLPGCVYVQCLKSWNRVFQDKVPISIKLLRNKQTMLAPTGSYISGIQLIAWNTNPQLLHFYYWMLLNFCIIIMWFQVSEITLCEINSNFMIFQNGTRHQKHPGVWVRTLQTLYSSNFLIIFNILSLMIKIVQF